MLNTTSSIIAIMLGRLRMELGDCEKAYSKLSEKIFTPPRSRANIIGQAIDFLQANGRFDAKVLESTIKECISTVADEDILLKDPGSDCKV
jgi:hypothetical protein